MSYREHPPPVELAPWLVCTWERDGDAPVRVLPDGCIDVVWTAATGSQIVGANTTAFVVPVSPGARIAGARMRPGAAPALFGVQAELVRDERAAAEAILGDRAASLDEALHRGGDPVATVEHWLSAGVAQAELPDPLIVAAVQRLGDSADDVAGLAAELGISGRGLRRRITAAIGYGPKRLGRVLRLRRALDAARAGGELGRVAFDAGYADQAHFCTECRELAGVPPTVLLSE